jgi:hypothetical protein
MVSRHSPLPFDRGDLLPCDEISRDLRLEDSLSSPLIENSQVLGPSPKKSRILKLFSCWGTSHLHARVNPTEFPIQKNNKSPVIIRMF